MGAATSYMLDPALDGPNYVLPLNNTLEELALQTEVYIHPRIVCYKNEQAKTNWQIMEDNKHRDTFSAIWAEKKDGKKQWVILFGTWTSTWVGKTWEEIKDEPWHAWGAAILTLNDGTKRGKRVLVIYDSESVTATEETSLAVKDLMGMQREFCKFARSKASIKEIWYSTDTRNIGQKKCAGYTLNWIKQTAGMKAQELADTDLSAQGFVKIGLNGSSANS